MATSTSGGSSFKQRLGKEELEYFNSIAILPFSEQAVAFLNAYWDEVGHQADFIFNTSWEFFKKTDMHYRGVEYLHQYEEGVNLDFNEALYFFEKLQAFCNEEKNFKNEDHITYQTSFPKHMTAITRKKELRSKVDVNFDGKVSFMEYLLYTYQGIEGVDPASFCERSMKVEGEPPEITAAKKLLSEVHKLIAQYETNKAKLEERSKLPGVKGLTAKNSLAQLGSSDLAQELNAKLIKAEAGVRKVQKEFGIRVKGSATPGGKNTHSKTAKTNGSVFWLNCDLNATKKRVNKSKKK